eukprot:COSAG02_NODE_3610_length_6484_cov_2.117269_1_plen_67_part_10
MRQLTDIVSPPACNVLGAKGVSCELHDVWMRYEIKALPKALEEPIYGKPVAFVPVGVVQLPPQIPVL